MKMYKKKLIEKMTQMSNNKYCIQMDKKIIVKTSKKVSTKIYKRAKKLQKKINKLPKNNTNGEEKNIQISRKVENVYMKEKWINKLCKWIKNGLKKQVIKLVK